jgi:hypothetical protein
VSDPGRVSLKSSAQGDLVRTVIEVTSDLPPDALRGSRGLRVLLERLAERWLPTSDPLAKARLRGAVAMRELLGRDGGSWTASQVATRLGISRQAIDKRRKAGQLLGVELPKRGVLYPAWQFTGTGTLVGLVEVLAALREHDPWAQARFFVAENDRLGARRPVELLRRGKLALVLEAANAFGEHGAA